MKAEYASLIPYRKRGDTYEYFVQKRSRDATRSPGLFGLFGGGMEEGETPEEGMLREIHEELDYVPTRYRFLFRYEFLFSVLHIYAEEVGSAFESNIVVHEGEYGTFMTLAELMHDSGVSPYAAVAIADLEVALRS